MRVRIVVSGRGYHHADCLPDHLEFADGEDVVAAVARIQAKLEEYPLPETCLVALGGRHLGSLAQFENAVLKDGDELLLITPVAGG